METLRAGFYACLRASWSLVAKYKSETCFIFAQRHN
jgi:hypothetical protein